MLHTREAWALACMDRPSGFRRATGQVAEALSDAGRPDGEPYWIGYFDDAELAGATGGRLLDMARADPRRYADQAADHIRTALDRRGPEAGRGHALDWIGLAECAFLLGDISSAADYSRRAVAVASDLLSGRVRAQLAQLYPYTVRDGVPRGWRCGTGGRPPARAVVRRMRWGRRVRRAYPSTSSGRTGFRAGRDRLPVG
ncbi:hypothetical protein [Streptomyces rugosispiralis]|uniref:hypothetical protein n=1 Tax=Streptomyces rugosispiralis TaxID=2967341 RepID=UPI0027E3DB27|nr:hypothetical protein [Streptomyces rugosispiralis]